MSIFPTKILLATDGSEEADLAARSAANLASSTGSELHVLTVGPKYPFYEIADVRVGISLGLTLGFMLVCLATTWWMLTTGWRLKK